VLVGVAVWGAPLAHADDSDPYSGTICTLTEAGETPAQISQQLQRGTNLGPLMAPQRVWTVILHDCP
jgi:hypothetical protein